MNASSKATAVRKDVIAGITTSIVTLPKAIAYGAIAFLPLGPDGVAVGVLAGVLSLIFGNLISLGGSNRILINSTFSLASMTLAAALTEILQRTTDLPEAVRNTTALTLLFFVMLCAGLLQVIVGFLRFGGLAKYIPQPVISGLVNGVSLLIVAGQLPVLLGAPAGTSLADFSGLVANLSFLNLLVGIVVGAGLLFGDRIVRTVPPVITGIVLGTGTFHLMAFVTGEPPGHVMGEFSSGIPTPDYLFAFAELDLQILMQLFYLIPYGLAVAGILSLWSLLFMASADNMAGTRSNGNHELVSQGLGNMMIACFGGVSVAGNSNTIINYANGGRGSVSKISCSLFALAILVIFNKVIALVPMVVLGVILVVYSISAIDKWSLKFGRILFSARNLRGGQGEPRGWGNHGLSDFTIMLAVMFIMLYVGVVQAVGIGICISIVLFIRRMGDGIIRADNDATRITSNVLRNADEQRFLHENGRKIRIIEIEGALFFGTTDQVADRIQSTADDGVKIVILDMRRITDVDSTGSELLVKLHASCNKNGQEILLSGIDTRETDNLFLQNIGTLDVFEGKHYVFLNDAIAHAEDELLAQMIGPERYNERVRLETLLFFEHFSADEIELAHAHCTRQEFRADDTIYQQGDAADSLYLLISGRVKIIVELEGQLPTSVSTLTPGCIFGELALDQQLTRYGTAVAESSAVCYRLDQQLMDRIRKENPELCHKLLAALVVDLFYKVGVGARVIATGHYI